MFLNEITYVKEVPTNKVLEAVTHFLVLIPSQLAEMVLLSHHRTVFFPIYWQSSSSAYYFIPILMSLRCHYGITKVVILNPHCK